MKTRLFSVTDKDLKWDYFRAGGNGGQKQNKTSSACRVTHVASGIACESREQRQQIQNRREALRKLAAHPKFILWCKMQYAANCDGYEGVAAKVDDMMDERNLRVETTDACIPGEIHVGEE